MVYNKTKKVLARQEKLRKKILAAAKEVMAEDTAGKFSIKSIAQKAGIATGTFYLYFANKEALIEIVVQDLYAELLAIIKEERARYTDVFDKLRASMEVCIKTFLKKRQMAKILLVYFPEINSTINSKFTHIEKDLINFVKEDIDQLLAEDRIPPQDSLVSATAFVGTFREVMLSWLNTEEEVDWEQAYNTLVEYNMRGIGKK
ncbi:MAG: TetR/AcrR family transcriptional regulator [Peptococcaceae bacterium]|jgi:TetR/AcrR family fatty acid metabolism transcriptional regulator|nr:TetR/AcrR family transcriptional regulator [Peptococcaceae bacterium]